ISLGSSLGFFTSCRFRSSAVRRRSRPPTRSRNEAARSTASPQLNFWLGIDPFLGRPPSLKACSLRAKRRHGKQRFQVVVGEVDPAPEEEISAGDKSIGRGVSDLLVEDVVDARGGEDVLESLNPQGGAQPRIAQLLDREVEGVQLEGQRILQE